MVCGNPSVTVKAITGTAIAGTMEDLNIFYRGSGRMWIRNLHKGVVLLTGHGRGKCNFRAWGDDFEPDEIRDCHWNTE